MALSLNDINKKNSNAAPKRAASHPNRKHIKPWETDVGEKKPKAKRTNRVIRDIPMTEADVGPVNGPKMSDHWLFDIYRNESLGELLNSHTIVEQARQVLKGAQRRSYWLSKLSQAQNWALSIQVQPKVKIPIPSFFSHNEGRDEG